MVDLLDARGYEINIQTDGGCPVRICYLGAVRPEHLQKIYEDDPYVVSHIKKKVYKKEWNVVLKDSGIRKSGLLGCFEAKEETELRITVGGEELECCHLHPGEKVEKIWDVSRLCENEKAYLENVHRILYLLLGEIDRICKKNNLRYFLVFGGLLGAVRYGDIVPWDDDVDIAMTREDFEKFKKVAKRDLHPDFMYLDCSKIGKGSFLDFMCRILYMKEEVPGNVFRKVHGKCRKGIENHLPMDIFILDKAFDQEIFHKIQMTLLRGIYGLGMGHRAYFNRKEYENRSWIVKSSVNILSKLGKLIPVSCVFWLHDKVSMMNQKKNTKDYFMSNGFLPFIHLRYNQEWFETNSIRRLGNMYVYTPADEKAYLKRAYFDYFHYPPLNKRISEHSPDADGVF